MAIFESKGGSITVTKSYTVASTLESTSTSNIFVAEAGQSYQVVSITERHSVVGSTTVMLVGALGSTPLGSGTNLLASTISMFSAVDIANAGTLLGSAVLSGSTVLGTTAAGPVLSPGDALGLRYGTPGNLLPLGVVDVVLTRL